MNNFNHIPITEDAIDMAVKDFFESKGFSLSYYNPPAGSWSILKLKVNETKYRTFSPRDTRRPDLIMYKQDRNKLRFLVIESKGDIKDLTETEQDKYFKSMHKYFEKIIHGNFRHSKCREGWVNWNKKISDLSSLNIEVGIGFIFGGNASDINSWSEEKNKFISTKNDYSFGIIVGVDWNEKQNILELLLGENYKGPRFIKKLFGKSTLKHFSY